MAGPRRDQRQHRQLSASVAVPKRMNRIQLGQKVGGVGNEFRCLAAAQQVLIVQPAEQPVHLGPDVLGVAEHAAAF
jgi:hypothetical protein